MLKLRRGHFLAGKQSIDQVEDAVLTLIGAAGGKALRIERDGDCGVAA